jgi:hypothetical protein
MLERPTIFLSKDWVRDWMIALASLVLGPLVIRRPMLALFFRLATEEEMRLVDGIPEELIYEDEWK